MIDGLRDRLEHQRNMKKGKLHVALSICYNGNAFCVVPECIFSVKRKNLSTIFYYPSARPKH